jgi:peptidoglycan/xylan/chitin deacetylase (PgdA/CDA1 family)
VRRAAILEHYGLKTLLRGTLLPGPDIGKRCADTLKSVRDAGFETGIHAWDHVRWQDGIPTADAEWTAREMEHAVQRFNDIFGVPPRVHGAAGWQMNIHSFRLTQRLGFDFCSDTRGTCPYIPVIDAEIVACPQIPTTLPTIDELVGYDGTTVDNVGAKILRMAAAIPAPMGHVLTVQAEIEGIKLLPVLDAVLQAWSQAGIQLLSLGAYLEAAGTRSLPRHRTAVDRVDGRIGSLAVQGPEFLPRSPAACV